MPGIQDEKPLGVGVAGEVYQLLYRNWTRDYFTSALPFQQRGTAVALPVFGSTNAEFDIPQGPVSTLVANTSYSAPILASNAGLSFGYPYGAGPAGQWQAGDATYKAAFDDLLSNNNTIDAATFSSVDIADLRLAWQTQVWMERNARGGARYTEQLQMRYGTRPLDARLQRPEFIGGYVSVSYV